MDPYRNPFAPGAGSPPPELTGREALLNRAMVALGRVRLGRPEKSFIVVGLRGVGKTVLLQHVRQMAIEQKLRSAVIEAHEGKTLGALLAPQLRRMLIELDRAQDINEHVKRGLRVLKSFASTLRLKYAEMELSLDIEPETGSADSGDLEADLPELFAAVGQAAAARNTGICLLIDEIQYLSQRDLSGLIMAMHRCVQEKLPIILVGAGLPQVVGLSGKSKSYAERLFDFPPLGPLDRGDAIRAIELPAQREHVIFRPRALEVLFNITKGYPYFLQAWGYHSWNLAVSSPIGQDVIETATPVAVRSLDDSFFRVRFDRLTPREKDYLRAMAELGPGPHRSGDIADCLGVRINTVAPLRNGLVGKGMIYSPAHGGTAFTVPLFDEYLKRVIPDWQTPYEPLSPHNRDL